MANVEQQRQGKEITRRISTGGGHAGVGAGHKLFMFQMPVHYPRYLKSDYEKMPEWQLDRLLSQYGLPVQGSLAHKRTFAMGAFLWPPN